MRNQLEQQMKFTALITIVIMTQFTRAGLSSYNNNQAYFNPYSNPVIPYCFLGNEAVCSTTNETFVNECVMMLLGQKMKHRGWCAQVKPKPEEMTDETAANGYGESSDESCPLCNDVFNPVCGINGVTYQNLCKLRECARIQKSNFGPCGVPDYHPPKDKECSCRFEFAPVCGSDFVTYQSGCVMRCSGAHMQNEGSCLQKCGCTKIDKPVCGMDRKTYLNDCERKCEGVEKLHDGECPNPKPAGCEHCEGFYNAVCGINGVTYDNLCYLQCAGVKLFCKAACPSIKKDCKCHQRYVPVCGIDNKTYRNDCLMECAEIRKQYNGICRNYEVDNTEIFGKCNCGNQVQPICGADDRTYLNPCYLDCLADGKAKYWGECKSLNPKECGCQDYEHPICAKDRKTYKNKCALECKKQEEAKEGKCEKIGMPVDAAQAFKDMIASSENDFTYSG